MTFRYYIEDCDLLLDGEKTGAWIGPFVGEFTVNRFGNVQCDALYATHSGIKCRPNSARLVYSVDEKVDHDLTSYAGTEAVLESAVAWAEQRIFDEEDAPGANVDPYAEHRLTKQQLVGGVA